MHVPGLNADCYYAARFAGGFEALFLRPARVFLLPMPAPFWRRGSAPVRRPELPPPMA